MSRRQQGGGPSFEALLLSTHNKAERFYYFSVSTYSASMTPSSFGWSAVPAAAASPSVGAVPVAACALYNASASLWLAVVRRSRAASSSVLPGSPVSVV